ncbi:hypothetical protein L6452_00773 [Arctium lappa]|uniref:Uncharacterized protein n=1 Tax=Arctium lappa TaxID=4217 RepID=A0ACB9FEF2_ARCLA|nr:hypothetical protein L6452_00773 [Arctium lappa]
MSIGDFHHWEMEISLRTTMLSVFDDHDGGGLLSWPTGSFTHGLCHPETYTGAVEVDTDREGRAPIGLLMATPEEKAFQWYQISHRFFQGMEEHEIKRTRVGGDGNDDDDDDDDDDGGHGAVEAGGL